jgi:hypothetical protein
MIHLLWLSLAVPVLIHLVHRRKAQQVPFSTLRFLRMVDRRVARRHRLKELLLLALRVLLLAALIGALYRPIVRSATFKGANVPATVAIALDNTCSMRASAQGVTRFERARSAAAGILGGLRRGDAAYVALFHERDPAAPEPTTGLGRLGDELDAMECGYGTAQAAGALRRALEALQAGVNPRKELYVITDFQRLSWPAPGPGEDAGGGPLESVGRAVPDDVPVFLVDVGGEVEKNLSLASAEFGLGVQVAGAASEVYCSVRNTGGLDVAGKLALHVEGEKVAEQDVALAPGAVLTAPFSHVFSRTGVVSGRAALDADELAPDNARHFVVGVHDKLPVLLVNGDPSGVPHLNETFFLELALQAPSGRGRTVSPIETRTVTAAELGRERLSDYACVVAANVPRFGELQADRLRQYVEGGGGLIIFAGDRVDPAACNAALAAVGSEPLLPALLTEVTAHPSLAEAASGEEGEGFGIRSLAEQHPIFRSIAGQMETDAARVRRLFAVKPPAGEQEPPALVATDGGPLLLERQAGAGVVLLFTSSADMGWSNLPARRFFLPLLHQMVYHAARSVGRGASVPVGAPYVLELPPEVAEAAVHGPPTGAKEPEAEPLAVLRAEGGRATFTGTDRPGVYRAVYRVGEGEQSRRFAVNVPPQESDMTRADPEEVAAQLGAAAVRVVAEPARLDAVVRRDREGLPLWDYLFALAIAAALVETYVANVLVVNR